MPANKLGGYPRFRKMKAKLKGSEGLSIVELLIILVVIAVLAAIAIPITQSQLRLHRLDSTASVVSGKLMEARMDAIKRNRTSRLVLTTGGQAQIQTTDAGGNTIVVGQVERFPSDVSLVSGTNVEVAFNSMGRLTSAQSFSLRDSQSGRSKNIAVSISGKVTVGGMY